MNDRYQLHTEIGKTVSWTEKTFSMFDNIKSKILLLTLFTMLLKCEKLK